jgi:glycosyltransferase involved in cell wall biosynthesis
MPNFCAAKAERMAKLHLTQVGHPFNPIGTGRATRLVFSSARAAGIDMAVRDVYNFQTPETAQAREILPFVTTSFGPVNLFHLNGDEIEPALNHLGGMPDGYNIVAPFWELPHFPNEWAAQVNRFNEVWAPSAFVRDAVAAAVDIPVLHMKLATEVAVDGFINRRHFGIPEDSFAFFTFFDGRSYMARKNPQAVVACFRRLVAARPFARTVLVIKLHGGENAPEELRRFLAGIEDLAGRVVVLQATMPEDQVHNLIRDCDAFVSLHRSEGFGLGLAEAMFLGKPVIGTGWSGNMDFMTAENSYPVPYELVPVPAGAYPHASGQTWAEPDLGPATAAMLALVDDPAAARALGAKASRDMRIKHSYRAAGLRYAARLSEITGP